MTNWMKKILATLCALALLLSCAVAEGLNEEAELPAASEIEVEEIELTPEEAAALQKTGSQADEPAEQPAEEKTEDGQPEEQAEEELPEEQPQAAEPAEDLQNEEQEEIIVSEIKTLSDEIASLAEEQQEEISAEEAPAEGIIPAEELADDPEAEPAQEEIILNLKQDAPHQIKGKVSSNKPYTVKATDDYSRTVLFTLTVPTENSITVTLDDKALTLTKIDTEESIQYTFTCKLVKEEVTSFILTANEGTVPFTLTISKIGTTEEAPEEETKEEAEEVTEEPEETEEPAEETAENGETAEVTAEVEEPAEETAEIEEPTEEPEEAEETADAEQSEETEEEPQEEPADEPTEENIEQPEGELVEEPAEEPAEEPEEELAGEKYEQQEEEPVEEPDKEPADETKGESEGADNSEETPVEKIEEKPVDGLREVTGEAEDRTTDTVDEFDASVDISVSFGEKGCRIGCPVYFTADLSQYDEREYSLQWQVSKDREIWTDIIGEESQNLEITLSEENSTYYWRIIVRVMKDGNK